MKSYETKVAFISFIFDVVTVLLFSTVILLTPRFTIVFWRTPFLFSL